MQVWVHVQVQVQVQVQSAVEYLTSANAGADAGAGCSTVPDELLQLPGPQDWFRSRRETRSLTVFGRNSTGTGHPPVVRLVLHHVHDKAETQDTHNQKAHEKDSLCQDFLFPVGKVQRGGCVKL